VQTRLEELKKELEAGQAELRKVEAQPTYLHETMLRISGAIQALEELLAEELPAEHDGALSHQERHATVQAGEANA
jgi:predicted nuclease with TOPRIM domain